MTRRSLSQALVASCAASVMLAALITPAVAGDRTARRAAELALPDPYLDPSWPETPGDETKRHYAPGRSDSVEDEPLDEEVEIQQEQPALPGPSGEIPPGALGAAAPGVATTGEQDPGVEQAPGEADPDAPQDDVDDVPDLDERDPVEW